MQHCILLVAAAAACLAFPATPATAQDAAAAVKLSGTVKIVSFKDQNVLAATLTAGDGKVYDLVLDAAGRDLAKVMFGNRVNVLGVATEKDGRNVLRVLSLPDPTDTEAFELWRRSRCNGCVISGAASSAPVPRELFGATPVGGRYYPLKRQFVAMARSDNRLWLATDNELLQLDLAARKQVGAADRKAGLPDAGVYDLATDGATLWIVHHGGVAAMPVAGGRIEPVAGAASGLARVAPCESGAWIVADTCTLRVGGDGKVARFPALPTADRISAAVQKGLWVADWPSQTAYLLTSPLCIGGRLYVGSFGAVYELADGQWKKIADSGWAMAAHGGRLWMLGTSGLLEYDPKKGGTTTHAPAGLTDGRLTGLLLTGDAAWVTAEPKAQPGDGGFVGGGVGRMDLATGQWQTSKTLGGRDATQAACFLGADGAVWAVTRGGEYRSQAAHPGMTYVQKKMFVATSLALHRLNADGQWQTISLPMPKLDHRFICGQDGGGGWDDICPQAVTGLCVGPKEVFAATQLFPTKYFSGYWPCVNRVAALDGAEWTGEFDHHPGQLDLQGEQPRVLNISNLGQRVLTAVGHDNVLETFVADGTPWAVTQGCAAWYDRDAGQWRKCAETGFRFYWRATAAVDDGRSLYVGSDRGLVSRLDFATGRFQVLGGLSGREITRIVAAADGRILVASAAGPLGTMPVELREMPGLLDADAAAYDGKHWTKIEPSVLPAAEEPAWAVRPPPGFKSTRGFVRDTRFGNFLWGPGPDGKPAPRYYVKEVFAPQFLCFGGDGRRLWLATYTGLVCVDLGGKEAGQ